MNLYNSYLPFIPDPSFTLQAPPPMLRADYFFATYFSPLMLTASQSLNQKRLFPYDSPSCLGEFDLATAASRKKLKLDTVPVPASRNMLKMPAKSLDQPKKPFKTESLLLNQPVITIDDDEDAITKETSTIINNFLGETGHFSWPIPFSGQNNLFEPSSWGLQNNQKIAKKAEIVIIDDDDQDHSIYQSTKAKDDIWNSSLISSETRIQESDKSQMELFRNEIDTDKVKVNNLMRHAKLPPFQLSMLKSQKRKIKSFAPVWSPDCKNADNVEVWIDHISQAIGIEVTNVEKITKAMMEFDNIDIALEQIRRNKAYYKNYFRIKNAGQSYLR